MLGVSLRRNARWIGLVALLFVLAATGCRSADSATPGASPTADRSADSASQLIQPLLTGTAPVLPSPTAQAPRSTPTREAPRPTATATPSPEPTYTPAPTPTPTATPAPALRRLTTGGCCTQPFWSPDSRWVLFIDKPSRDAPLGIWSVDISAPEATPALATERIAFYTDDLSYVIDYGRGETAIEHLDGPLSATVAQRWTVPAGGRPISISPGRTRIAWQVSNDDLPIERRTTEIWVADFDGSNARAVTTLYRGGLDGWISDDALLLAGRESLQSRETVAFTLSLFDGTTLDLVRAERPRGYWLSPDRRWMAYYITFSEDPAQNGLWLARTDGTEQRQLDRGLFGSFAWRDARRLLIVPFQSDAVYHELWEYDVQSGEARRLADPGVTPLKIANADWQVSPDGAHVAFVESSDRNIWVLTLVE